MMALDAAIDDYLHTIIRSRPWAKKREEELLGGFSEWLYAQPNANVTLDSLDSSVVTEYATSQRLDAAEQDELLATLNNLYVWAIYAQAVDANPFSACSVA